VPAAAGIQGGQTLFLFERCKRHVGRLAKNLKSFKKFKKFDLKLIKYYIEI